MLQAIKPTGVYKRKQSTDTMPSESREYYLIESLPKWVRKTNNGVTIKDCPTAYAFMANILQLIPTAFAHLSFMLCCSRRFIGPFTDSSQKKETFDPFESGVNVVIESVGGVATPFLKTKNVESTVCVKFRDGMLTLETKHNLYECPFYFYYAIIMAAISVDDRSVKLGKCNFSRSKNIPTVVDLPDYLKDDYSVDATYYPEVEGIETIGIGSKIVIGDIDGMIEGGVESGNAKAYDLILDVAMINNMRREFMDNSLAIVESEPARYSYEAINQLLKLKYCDITSINVDVTSINALSAEYGGVEVNEGDQKTRTGFKKFKDWIANGFSGLAFYQSIRNGMRALPKSSYKYSSSFNFGDDSACLQYQPDLRLIVRFD